MVLHDELLNIKGIFIEILLCTVLREAIETATMMRKRLLVVLMTFSAFCSALHLPAARLVSVSKLPTPAASNVLLASQTTTVHMLLPVPVYLALVGHLGIRALCSTGWHGASVQTALISLTLLDFAPTARRQLKDAAMAAAHSTTEDVTRWTSLVRLKILGEWTGLGVAGRSPCVGAAIVLLSHLLFWAGGAARIRVDASGKPAPLPPPVAQIIWKADAAVLALALVGVFAPTPGLRAAGSVLFAFAGALVSLEQVPKAWQKFVAFTHKKYRPGEAEGGKL